MARLQDDDGTGPSGRDSLAGGIAGSDALALGFRSDAAGFGDALAGGVVGSDALAAGSSADALAAGSAAGSTLAVPTAGDALAVTGGGRDPLSGYADAAMIGDPVPLDRPGPAPAGAGPVRPSTGPIPPSTGPVPPSTGPVPPSTGPIPPSTPTGPAGGRRRGDGRRAAPAWARPGGPTANPARPGSPARPGDPYRPGAPARPRFEPVPWAGGSAGGPGGPTVGGALPAPGTRSGPTWEELNRRGAPTGPRYGGPPPSGRPRSVPPGTVPWTGQGGSGWDNFFTGGSGSARGLGGVRGPRSTRPRGDYQSAGALARAVLDLLLRGGGPRR